MMQPAAVDLFCGAGGLTYGLEAADIPVAAGIDIDESCRYPYETNTRARFRKADVSKIDSSLIQELFLETDIPIIVGCAPCQPFSKYTQGKSTTRDEKWSLLYDMGDVISEVLPPIVSMENVPELINFNVFNDFVDHLLGKGYSIWYDTVHAPRYGVPQDRERLVLLASRFGDIRLREPRFDEEKEYPSVEDAIGHLPVIKAGEVHPDDSFHRSAGLGETNLERIKHSKPGGTWEDWPEELKLECHKKASGSAYVGVYGRMTWEKPAPTITTQFYNYGSGRFGHPVQDRALSFREGALLQTFPDDYEFRPDNERLNNETAGRMIGNAVPVELGKAIGQSINQHLQNQNIGKPIAAD